MAKQTGPYTVVVGIYTLDYFLRTTPADIVPENCHLETKYSWLGSDKKEPTAVPFRHVSRNHFC